MSNTPEQRRRHNLKKYDLTPKQYEEMLRNQNRRCAICYEPPDPKRRLAVDHNHATGLIRGLLCHRCNVALDLLKDDLETARALVSYLYQHQKKLWEMP